MGRRLAAWSVDRTCRLGLCIGSWRGVGSEYRSEGVEEGVGYILVSVTGMETEVDPGLAVAVVKTEGMRGGVEI